MCFLLEHRVEADPREKGLLKTNALGGSRPPRLLCNQLCPLVRSEAGWAERENVVHLEVVALKKRSMGSVNFQALMRPNCVCAVSSHFLTCRASSRPTLVNPSRLMSILHAATRLRHRNHGCRTRSQACLTAASSPRTNTCTCAPRPSEPSFRSVAARSCTDTS